MPGSTLEGPAQAIAAGRTVLFCEWPAFDGTASADDYLHVGGWVWCAAGLEAVTISLAGRRFVPRTGLLRPDVERAYSGSEGSASGFFGVIDLRGWTPRSYELTVQALTRSGEAVARTASVHVGPDLPYRSWLEGAAARDSNGPGAPPRPGPGPVLSVVVLDVGDAAGGVEASLGHQTYPRWSRAGGGLEDTLREVADGGAPAVLVEDRGRLAPVALARLASALSRSPAPDLVYADEDARTTDGGRGAAFLKPGWAPDLLRHSDYIGPLVAIGPRAAASVLAAAGKPPASVHEVVLRLDPELAVERVPQVLFTCGAPRKAATAASPQPSAVTREPVVSVVIPSCSQDLLGNCLRSLRDLTTHRRLEVVVVDSSRDGLDTGELLEGVAHHLVPLRGRFTFSAAVNAGARAATGECLLFLNDDTEVITPDWIERMVEHVQMPGVGVVGSKLLLADGTVQHAGMVIAPGATGVAHVHLGFPADAPGYRDMLQTTRNWSAVTGACMMVKAALFDELGGFDEEFESEFSDVDLCLRAVQGGRRVVWTPHAVLTHFERSSLPTAVNMDDARRFVDRWGGRYADGDPLYHPAFSLVSYELPRGGLDALEPPAGTPESIAEAIVDGRPVLVCGTPKLDGTDRAVGVLEINGCAYSRAGLEDVFVYFDGLRYRARHGLHSPDLLALHEELGWSGFELAIELDERQAGALDLAVAVHAKDGQTVGVRGETFGRPSPAGATPLVADEQPADLGDAEREARYHWAAHTVQGLEVLDAGCGPGRGTLGLAAAGAERAVGIDVEQPAGAEAQSEVDDRAEFVVGDLLELPFESGSFDVAICFEALSRVHATDRALDELQRVLRPEGLLLLSVPNGGALGQPDPLDMHEFHPDEIATALGRRFANVRLFRQQSHLASVIGDYWYYTPAPEQDLAARVRRLTESRPGEEVHTLAAASDAKLPAMGTLAVLGENLDEWSRHELEWSLRERSRAANIEPPPEQAGDPDAARTLEVLKGSKSWRMTQPLRSGASVLRRGRAIYRGLPRRRPRS